MFVWLGSWNYSSDRFAAYRPVITASLGSVRKRSEVTVFFQSAFRSQFDVDEVFQSPPLGGLVPDVIEARLLNLSCSLLLVSIAVRRGFRSFFLAILSLWSFRFEAFLARVFVLI